MNMSYYSKVNVAETYEKEADEVGRKDATTSTSKRNAYEFSTEPRFERITGLAATAGIETEMENYHSQHSQRRHYSEANEDGTANEITDQQLHYSAANEKGSANEIAEQRRHYSEAKDDSVNKIADQRRHYSEAKDDSVNEVADHRRHYSEAKDDSVNEVADQRRHYSEAEDDSVNEVAGQRRHYSEAEENATNDGMTFDEHRHYFEGGEDVPKNPHHHHHHENVTADANYGEANFEVATAGIDTKIENYENIRTQRRHFFETEYDGMKDGSAEENASDDEDMAEADEETAKIEKAARVEKKIVEDCEGILSHRKHFPGSTTSHIFNRPYVA